MHNRLLYLILLLFGITAGCAGEAGPKHTDGKKVLLTVEFQKNETLQYKFVSEREITINWEPNESPSGHKESPLNITTETLDLSMAYTPVEIIPYGLTTIKAACLAATVKRNGSVQKDAAEYFAGKNYTFTVDSSGKIHDYSQLNELIKQAGQKAFSSGTDKNRIKDSDMISDFIATQWFLWDSIASIPDASKGIVTGQTWTSKLSVPTPMVSRLARQTVYSLDEILTEKDARIAVIGSTFSKSDSVPKEWPVPYSGSFQMRGTFGLLSGYKLLDLTGKGRELFNINSGQIEENNQLYSMTIQASVPMGLSVKPLIKIKQTISMKLIED